MRKAVSLLSGVAGFLSFATTVSAQTEVGNFNLSSVQGNVGLPAGTALDLILHNAFLIVFAVAALLALGFLIYGAIKWIMSGGDKEGTKPARQYITTALVGLALLAMAFVIIRVVGLIFNFDVLSNFTIPRLNTPIK